MSSAADNLLRGAAIIQCKRAIREAQQGMARATRNNEQEFLAYRGMVEELKANLVELETT